MVVSDVAAVSDLLKHLSKRRLTAHLLHTFLRTVATHEKKEWKQWIFETKLAHELVLLLVVC